MSAATIPLAAVPARHAVSARRRIKERVMVVLLGAAALGAAAILVIILGYVIVTARPR